MRYRGEYLNLVEQTFASMNKNSIEAAVAFNQTVNIENNPVDDHFPKPQNEREPGDNSPLPTRLQENMRIVARAINAQATLGQDRQTFFISDGGYDNHDELINNQSVNMRDVSQTLKNFQDAMDAIGMTDNVLLFTASDFARTLNSNGRGSDHAWGGNQIVMGGAVQGGRLHGTYPMSLAPGNDLDLGRGRLLPTTSVDELACELAMWYGLANDNKMEDILPNIRGFHDLNDENYPIGFLS